MVITVHINLHYFTILSLALKKFFLVSTLVNYCHHILKKNMCVYLTTFHIRWKKKNIVTIGKQKNGWRDWHTVKQKHSSLKKADRMTRHGVLSETSSTYLCFSRIFRSLTWWRLRILRITGDKAQTCHQIFWELKRKAFLNPIPYISICTNVMWCLFVVEHWRTTRAWVWLLIN